MTDSIHPYSTATQMLAALEARTISSVELTEMHLERIVRRDGPLNAIPVPTAELAREAALRADASRMAGQQGALLGLPMTLKESTQVAGLPQSAGIMGLAEYQPAHDGPIARRVFEEGACLLGKTNIPVALGDWQADSPVYGTTNNPWDLACTPGGSTGGGAAALAAGMTPLEIGSDIGGSIRVPAAYCGVYGHRPSETAIPKVGAFPMSDRPNPAFMMGVQGPLSRSAFDLELLFDVVAGPEEGDDAGWRFDPPPARHRALEDFRVAVMPPSSLVSPSAAMAAKVDDLASFLSRVGATVGSAMPVIDEHAYFADYLTLLTVMTSRGMDPEARSQAGQRLLDTEDPLFVPQGHGMTLDAHDYLRLLDRREAARAAWRAFFVHWDVVICPTALDAAFPHVDGDQRSRTLSIDGSDVPYMYNIVYPMWAIYAGQPATAFPAGLNVAGLPLGLQAIGPYLEDRTTLHFAQLLERDWCGFEVPPGY